MFFIKLTLFKIKRMLRFLPGITAGALALCFIMGIFAYGANKLIYKENAVDKQVIGVVRPEEDKYIDLVLGMVKNIESVESICEFTYVNDEATALEMLNSGELDGAVILPYRFIQNIVYGENVPARVILPENSSLYSRLFKDLADNGIGMLADVQAAVQAGFYSTEGEDNKALDEKVKDYNMMYLNIYLPRGELFKNENVSASGTLSIGEYYGIGAISVILLLSGTCLAFVTGNENKSFESILKRRGIGKVALFLADNIMVMVFYILLYALIIAGLYIGGIDFSFNITAAFLSLVLISLIVSGVYTVFSAWAGALVLFVFVLVSAFVGGAVLPEAFLPESVAFFTGYSPVYIIYGLLSAFLTEELAVSFGIYSAMVAGIYAFVVGVQLFREVKEV